MDEQLKTLQLSPNPDSQHHYRVLLYGLGALFLILIAGGIGYFWGININQESNAPVTIQNQQSTFIPSPFPTMPNAISPTIASVDITSWKTYSAFNFFTIKYPPQWRLESTLTNYATLQDAEKVSGNYFDIWSFTDPNKYSIGTVPNTELKVEVIFTPDVTKNPTQWAVPDLASVQKSETIMINGNVAKKVWQQSRIGAGGQVLSVFYKEGIKEAIFNSWPSDSKYAQEFDDIVMSFKFSQ